MPSRSDRRTQLARTFSALVALALTVGCDTTIDVRTPLPPSASKPVITFQQPTSGTSIAVDDPVPVKGVAQDTSGVLRVDLLVNGTVVDTQSAFVATTRFEYSRIWRPKVGGQTTLTLVAYNVSSVASDPVSVTLNVSGQTATPTVKAETPTLTPFVQYVSVTPSPTPLPVTPAVTVVTTTPIPSQTPQPTAISVYTVARPATILPTSTQSSQ